MKKVKQVEGKISLKNLDSVAGGVTTIGGIDREADGRLRVDFNNLTLSDTDPQDSFQLIEQSDGTYVMLFKKSAQIGG